MSSANAVWVNLVIDNFFYVASGTISYGDIAF